MPENVKTCRNTPLASPPGGPYSQIVLHGSVAYLAGCTPHRPGSGEFVGGTFEEQARVAFTNLQTLAREAGSDLRHALKAMVYLRDMADFPAMNGLFAEFMGDRPPVRTTLPVDLPGFAIEIDAIIALPADH